MRQWLNNIITATLVVMVVGVGLVLMTRTVKADPHAVFYTAIGQQQLFYNVLAALDQADYVETQYAREQLIEKRAGEETTPPFEDEEFPLTEATKVGQERRTSETDPGIADILSRLITLEGTDLYNDQLVREFGAESGRRNATSELLRTLCAYGLGLGGPVFDLVGLEDCDLNLKGTSGGDQALIEAARKTATVRDPLEWGASSFTEGVLGVLGSGTEKDLLLREQRVLLNPYDPLGNIPRAYSPEIAQWRRQIAEIYDADPKQARRMQQELDNMLVQVALSYLPVGYDIEEIPPPFDKIYTDSSTGLSSLKDSPGADLPSTDEAVETISNLTISPIKIKEIAELGAQRVSQQLEMMYSEGLLADVKLVNHALQEGNYEEISVLIDNPVAVRKADVYSLPVALALLDTSQQASALAGLDKPGSQQLVERGSGTSGPTCNCVSPGDPDYDPSLPMCQVGDPQCGSVQGLQTTAETGQVLGKLDLFGLDKRYDDPKEPTSPSANLIAGHLEQGAVQALRVLTGGNFRKTTGGVPSCGYTCY